MKKVTLKQVKPYEAPGHFNMVTLKLHGKEVDETWTQCTYQGNGMTSARPE